MSTASFLRTSVAAATLGTLLAGTALALPAAAEINGYQTGYQYTQGLAIGAGARLEQQAMNGQTGTGYTYTTTTHTTATPVRSSVTTPTNATMPAANTQTSVAPAVNSAAQTVGTAATAAKDAAQSAANTVGNTAQQAATAASGISLATAVGWGALALAVILIAAAIWSFFAQDRVTRTRREAAYQ